MLASDNAGGVASGSYGVDAAGRLDSITRNLAGTSADVTTTFGYNRAGQLASETRSNDAYAFDALRNVDRSYTANGLNQYSAAGTASFGYDANGNLTSSTAPNASGTPVTTSYVYDVENRLVSVSGGVSGALRYDPLGRLYEITEGGSTTRLLYDGDALVGEYAANGTTLRRYAHGVSAGDDPVAWYEGSDLSSSTRRYLYADRLGSITNVVSNSGASIAINTFDEYGIPGSGNQGRFQYTGQAFLEGIGLYHYKARMYSPSLGRFMQTDPIGYADGMNWYDYVGGDPVNAVDPTGMFRQCYNVWTVWVDSVTREPTGKVEWKDRFCIGEQNPATLNFGQDGGRETGGGRAGPQSPNRPISRAKKFFGYDPCSGSGSGPAAEGYSPYPISERSVGTAIGDALVKHNGSRPNKSAFSQDFLNPAELHNAIWYAVQSNPNFRSDGAIEYTVNLGREVGYDAKNGGYTDYLTVLVRKIDGIGYVGTVFPGCSR